MKTANRNKRTFLDDIIKGSLIVLFILVNDLLLTPKDGFPIIPNTSYRHGHTGYDPEYHCFSNIRRIYGALEIYNMDHSEPMDDLDIDILIREKYLKKDSIEKVKNNDCTYSGHNLSKDGYVECPIHGSPVKQEREQEARKLKEEKYKIYNLIKLVAIIVVCLLI